MSNENMIEEGITEGIGSATEKGLYVVVIIGGVLIGGYIMLTALIPRLPKILKGEPDIWKQPDERTPEEELFVIPPFIPPITPALPPDKIGVSGVNWLSGRCRTLQNNILSDLELEGKDKAWGFIPIPKGEDRWYNCARRIETYRKRSGCDAKQQDIYQYLTSIAERNLANRGKAARMVKVKYKSIYGRRW